jgi:hypothetical protein
VPPGAANLYPKHGYEDGWSQRQGEIWGLSDNGTASGDSGLKAAWLG